MLEALARDAVEDDSLAALSDGEDVELAVLRRFDDLVRAGAVRVDHGRRAGRQQLPEQAQLGLEVILEGGMIIEVVARDVRESARREAHAVEPVLVEAMAGGFECQVGHALRRQRCQIFVKRNRIGRGMRERRLAFRLSRCRPCRGLRLRSRSPPRFGAEKLQRKFCRSCR